ncbi:MAG: flippase-like domain-containing protein [Ignavibacteriota bacterium]
MNKNLRIALSTAGVAAACYLFYNVLSTFDWSAVGIILSSLAPWKLVVLLLPFFLEVIFDCLGWRHLLPTEFRQISIWKIFRARTGPEAIVMTVPMGPFISEPLKAWILFKITGLKTSIGMASVLLRSCFLVLAQCTVVILTTILGFNWINGISNQVIGSAGLSVLILASAGLLLAVYAGSLMIASRSSMIKRLHNLLKHAKFVWVRKVWASSENYFTELNEQFQTFGNERRSTLGAAFLIYLLPWIFQCIETFVILSLLGSDISILHAFAIEAACGFLRSVAFMVPSGLGVQDSAYYLMLSAAEVSHPLAAAFILIKRSREVLWIGLGYGMLLFSGFSLKTSMRATQTNISAE